MCCFEAWDILWYNSPYSVLGLNTHELHLVDIGL